MEPGTEIKKEYQTPDLTVFGTMNELTLTSGLSGGDGLSGSVG